MYEEINEEEEGLSQKDIDYRDYINGEVDALNKK